MTVSEILTAALNRLGRGTDNLTMDNYRAPFLDYTNVAVRIIARQYKPVKKETIALDENYSFHIDDLSRECTKITKIEVNGSEVDFEQEADGNGVVVVETTTGTSCDVYYRFVPKLMTNDIDVPELPKHFHEYIPYYIVASERCGGDPYTQGTSSPDFQMFNTFVASIESCKLGQASAYTLKNY